MMNLKTEVKKFYSINKLHIWMTVLMLLLGYFTIFVDFKNNIEDTSYKINKLKSYQDSVVVAYKVDKLYWKFTTDSLKFKINEVERLRLENQLKLNQLENKEKTIKNTRNEEISISSNSTMSDHAKWFESKIYNATNK